MFVSVVHAFSGPLSLSKDLNKFESIFKIPRKTFNYICLLAREDLLVRTIVFTSTYGKVLSVGDQIAVALRRLCSGDSLSSGGLLCGINQSTAAPHPPSSSSDLAICGGYGGEQYHRLKWPNSEEMVIMKSKFEKIQGLPICCGAIDTTHINMCQPSSDPPSYGRSSKEL